MQAREDVNRWKRTQKERKNREKKRAEGWVGRGYNNRQAEDQDQMVRMYRRREDEVDERLSLGAYGLFT
jgi:hypothetical protein